MRVLLAWSRAAASTEIVAQCCGGAERRLPAGVLGGAAARGAAAQALERRCGVAAELQERGSPVARSALGRQRRLAIGK